MQRETEGKKKRMRRLEDRNKKNEFGKEGIMYCSSGTLNRLYVIIEQYLY